jgi:DNA-binding NarL/FixJ family response regulator
MAADGLEAVRLADRCRPDVVVTDVRMPILDGMDATRQIKRRWPHVRVVAISMCEAFRVGSEAAGADEFLVKGGSSDDLMAAIVAGRPGAGVDSPDSARITPVGDARMRRRSRDRRRRRSVGLPPSGARSGNWMWSQGIVDTIDLGFGQRAFS